ncbi:hypothetical protein, partial [Ralstonia pseudosolanacearum]
ATFERQRTIAGRVRTTPFPTARGCLEKPGRFIAASSVASFDYATSLWGVRSDCERAGLNNLGFNLGLRRLTAKKFVEAVQVEDERGDPYPGIQVTEQGWQWIEANENKFKFHSGSGKKASASLLDDGEIPF